jgi:hypothetical protein
MSYLAPLRLHFAGTFQAAVSTVNNSASHYDNDSFSKRAQQPGPGGWNPRGNADWRLIGCEVTAAFHADGSPAAPDDPLLELLVADSDSRVPAKLVDLDPEQQLVSMIFGLEIRICDRSGATLVRGEFEPAPFVDLFARAIGGSRTDFGMGAAYQSVLTDLRWGDVSSSPLLTELRAAATDDLLSIRFNVDGYNHTLGEPGFALGRVVGTIGVASAAEPRHFAAGRQLIAAAGGFVSRGAINYCTAVVDEARGQILLDLGNALPTSIPGGPQADIGELTLGYVPSGAADPTPLGTIHYRSDGWYDRNAGVCEVAVDADDLAAIAAAPLVLGAPGEGAVQPSRAAESPDGLNVRADLLVYRPNPGETVDVTVFATRYGEPYAGAQVTAAIDMSQLQVSNPGPDSAISFPDALKKAGRDGRATLPITASAPGNPRGWLDGQVYGVRPSLADADPAATVDPWTYVSLHVHDAFEPDEPLAWWGTPAGSLEPIFRQYANLYPVMDLFLDLSQYRSVCENVPLLRLAFGLDERDANSMPVTRDLSAAKRAAILRWLNEPGPDGKPLLGTPPAEPPGDGLELGAPPPDPSADVGGKTAALARRRGARG